MASHGGISHIIKQLKYTFYEIPEQEYTAVKEEKKKGMKFSAPPERRYLQIT
jgi:hypothetical protein